MSDSYVLLTAFVDVSLRARRHRSLAYLMYSAVPKPKRSWSSLNASNSLRNWAEVSWEKYFLALRKREK